MRVYLRAHCNNSSIAQHLHARLGLVSTPIATFNGERYRQVGSTPSNARMPGERARHDRGRAARGSPSPAGQSRGPGPGGLPGQLLQLPSHTCQLLHVHAGPRVEERPPLCQGDDRDRPVAALSSHDKPQLPEHGRHTAQTRESARQLHSSFQCAPARPGWCRPGGPRQCPPAATCTAPSQRS